MTEEEARRARAPYFFLSYARSPKSSETGRFDGDQDSDVLEFFDEICQHIKQIANVERGAQAGYLDRAMRTSTRWDEAVKEALATCRTFVALYKPSYFESEWCGREWAAFEARQNLTKPEGSVAHDAIIPVLWVEEMWLPDPMPSAARYVQYADSRQPDRYRLEGIYGLRRGRYREDYGRATLAIARNIVDVARTTQIAPCQTSVFSEDANAFRSESV